MAVSIQRLQSEAIDSYGSKQAYDNLARYNGVIWWLGQKGNIVLKEGGLTFRERILYGLNSNVGFRGAGAPVPQTDDEGFTLAVVDQKTIDGAIVYNQKELDQVRGTPALAVDLVTDKTEQFSDTWVQVWANALLQASPGADDPITLLGGSGVANSILLPTAPASQTVTTAGISRSETVTLPDGSTIRWWANQYSSTSYDLTATAGRRGLYLDVYSKCIRGNGGGWEPDFGLIGDVVWASLEAAGDANRRYTADEASLKLGFENIRFHNAVLFIDRSPRMLNGSAGKVIFLNSKALKLHVLQGTGGVTKEMLDQRNNLKSVPIFWKHKNMSEYNTLKYNWLGYCNANLVPKSLQDHGLADNCI